MNKRQREDEFAINQQLCLIEKALNDQINEHSAVRKFLRLIKKFIPILAKNDF